MGGIIIGIGIVAFVFGIVLIVKHFKNKKAINTDIKKED